MTDSAMVECLVCGTPNAQADTVCANCGAQLAGGSLAAAPALTTESPVLDQVSNPDVGHPDPRGGPSTEGAAQGDWLAQLLAASGDDTEVTGPAASPGEGFQQPELPIWLRDLSPEEVGPAADVEMPVPGDEGGPAGEPGEVGLLAPDVGPDDLNELAALSGASAAMLSWGGYSNQAERDAAVDAGLALLADELAAGDLEDDLLAGAIPVSAQEGLVGPAPQWGSAMAASELEVGGTGLDGLWDGPEANLAGQPIADWLSVESSRGASLVRGSPSAAAAVALPGLGEARADVTGETLLARAHLIEELASRPSTPRRVMSRRSLIGRSDRLMRLLVPAVLVAVVVLALVAPLGAWGKLVAVRLPAGYPAGPARMYDVVRHVGRGDKVLVAFEYGQAEADELDLVAAPVVRQLLVQEADISVVSTRTDGLVAARGLLRETLGGMVASGAIRDSDPGERYAVAGYRPGDAVGVAQMLHADDPPDLVVVFAARAGPLRWWVEQSRAMVDPPVIVAGTSAALEAVTSPYFGVDAGQLAGAVSGVSGAAYYERIAKLEMDQPAARRLEVLAAGNLAIVALVIVGAAASGLGGARDSRGGRM